MDRSLKLSEKLFCLAVNPRKGGLLMNASSTLSMTLTGSVVIELLKKELISIQDGMVYLENANIQSDEIYEFFLNRIRLRAKSRKLRNWISYFNVRGRKIQKLFIRSLMHKNVLRTEQKRILFIPYEKVYLMDHVLVENIRKDIEITSLNLEGSSDDSIILSVMIAKTNLLSRIFPDRERRKVAARNLKKLPDTAISKAVQEAIDMMHAAIYAAIS
jgi:uncharacterized protein YeeX (DUF496 family)